MAVGAAAADAAEEPGPCCHRLLKELKGIQRATVKDRFGWLKRVQKSKGYAVKGGHELSDGRADSVDKLP
ncbi:hypothetical protein H2199_001956 [Coniosporium tulheliwenetii]|uniref:Uncharacterized protein n=1 Tax=Coniosporium tulheliwenetii TaxID=3383036 RepID=A0ACC2ZL09_9PEZI|nr:hypothetical protein H2199_001956 [Cladosporium sp. JES 115]